MQHLRSESLPANHFVTRTLTIAAINLETNGIPLNYPPALVKQSDVVEQKDVFYPYDIYVGLNPKMNWNLVPNQDKIDSKMLDLEGICTLI